MSVKPDLERIMGYVDQVGPVPRSRPDLGPCWLWQRSKTAPGYAQARIEGTVQLVHRWLYEQMVSTIPAALTLDHLCRVRHCVNPAHLEPVSRGENVLRGESPAAQANRQTRCSKGHLLTPGNLVNTSRRQRRCLICSRQQNQESIARRR